MQRSVKTIMEIPKGIISVSNSSSNGDVDNQNSTSSVGEGGNYWKQRYEKLLIDYNNLLEKNQYLENKILNVADDFIRKQEELVANIEYEKSTLMADVNKLSTKLVDARIKLHDYEEREILHASECNSPCHDLKKTVGPRDNSSMQYDPNLV